MGKIAFDLSAAQCFAGLIAVAAGGEGEELSGGEGGEVVDFTGFVVGLAAAVLAFAGWQLFGSFGWSSSCI